MPATSRALTRLRPVAVAVILGLLAATGACTRPPTLPPTVPTSAPGAARPNVVRILTDDQDISSLRFMTKTVRLLGSKGVTFTESTVNLSLCCPSRATALTGQYAHNHKVVTNGGNLGGYSHFDHQENTLAPWLRASGYATAHVGKYMNAYTKARAAEVPPGWDEWFTVVDAPDPAYPFYNYTVSDNGTARTYGARDQDYITDVFADRAVQSLRRMQTSGKPFFLDFWPTAPHYGKGRTESTHLGPVAAPRHEQANPGLGAPRTANFLPAKNEIPTSLQTFGKLFQWANGGEAGFPQLVDESYRAYANSLLAVDDAVERFVQELEASGQLANTLIIFTSDNGLLWGNHGLVEFKWEPYEESLRVPLLISGPGFPKGVMSNRPVSNVDIVPTILKVTGAAAGRALDGKALVPYPSDPSTDAGRALLVQSSHYDDGQPYQFNGFKVPRFTAVRARGYQLTQWADGFVELFDLRADRVQMHNLAADPAHAARRAALADALKHLERCAGASCNVTVAA